MVTWADPAQLRGVGDDPRDALDQDTPPVGAVRLVADGLESQYPAGALPRRRQIRVEDVVQNLGGAVRPGFVDDDVLTGVSYRGRSGWLDP